LLLAHGRHPNPLKNRNAGQAQARKMNARTAAAIISLDNIAAITSGGMSRNSHIVSPFLQTDVINLPAPRPGALAISFVQPIQAGDGLVVVPAEGAQNQADDFPKSVKEFHFRRP
jgi:hypothetical protein